jgi:miniconductance mechanosensitive channel
MLHSDGRRKKDIFWLKRVASAFLNNDELKELKKITLISAYLDTRMSEVDSYNMNNDIDKSLAINGRNITNLDYSVRYAIPK